MVPEPAASACRQWVSARGRGSALACLKVANSQTGGEGRLLPLRSCPPERTDQETRELLTAPCVEATPAGLRGLGDAQVGTGLCCPQAGVQGPAGSLQCHFPTAGPAAKTSLGRQHWGAVDSACPVLPSTVSYKHLQSAAARLGMPRAECRARCRCHCRGSLG